MTAIGPVPRREIGEDDIAGSQAGIRYQTIERYEQLWQLASSNFQLAEDSGRPTDPRWAEIAIRILKEESSLFRLGQPPRVNEDEELPYAGMDPKEVVMARLDEIDAAIQKAKQEPSSS